MKKIGLLVMFTVLLIVEVKAQGMNWANAKQWKLYDIHDRRGFAYPVDTLKYFNSVSLNEDDMHRFMTGVAPMESKQTVWMGLYVATCVTDSIKLRKVIISTYGGFFFDQETRQNYQVSADLRKQWTELFIESSRKIEKN